MIDLTSPTPLIWALAATPIAVILVLMVFFRWGGAKAGPAGWFVALGISILAFKSGPSLLAHAQLEAVLLTLYVLYIIWLALVLYHVVDRAGAIKVISRGITRVTSDGALQLLLLGWAFSSFLQGVAGFGVPIAVVAPLLIGLGFSPAVAVAGAAIGHSWSVTFGDIASSFNALIAATGLTGWELAPWSALFLGVACFGCGIAITHIYGGGRTLLRTMPAILILGGSMALTQYFLAVNGLWNLAGFAAGMVGMATGYLVARSPLYRRPSITAPDGPPCTGSPAMSLPLAISPYLILIIIVAGAELWEPLHNSLNHWKLSVAFPAVSTGLGWETPERIGRTISLLGHPGALLAYSSVIAMIIFFLRGRFGRGDVKHVLQKTVKDAIPSSIGIISMVGMGMIMDRSGMTYVLAQGLSSLFGNAYPFASPYIGLLGAFMTGSNTNSNVVFAPLQQSAAHIAGLNALVILGAQTTGGAIGSMIAPAKIIVGCSTAGLSGQEGRVLRLTLPYAILITTIIGGIALAAHLIS